MSKCPVCGTYFGEGPCWLVKECGGDGNCPARDAGELPSLEHVLCACNRRWLANAAAVNEGHGFNDCDPST